MAFKLQEFEEVFEIRNAQGESPVLIGGQAVNYWAETYLAQEQSLEKWRPFTSEDIDFHGRRDDVIRAAKKLGVRAELPHRKQMTPWAGMVPFKIGDTRTSIDFVRILPGFPNSKIESLAVAAVRNGKQLRVLDPISLLSCKAYLATRVDQKERRDADHMRIMVVCVRAFLREVLHGMESGQITERGWLNAIKRLLKLSETRLGKKVAKQFGVDWQQALPLLEIAISSHRAAIQLREKRLPQWAVKLRGR